MSGEPRQFVSRAGRKLAHALDTFELDVTGLTCADFGCNVGGFTDCLLQRGAACVHAIDTGYGTLAWKLRQDARVVVRERTNVLHADAPDDGVDLVTIDVAWTPQRHVLPVARRWLRPGGRIITLVKPHYELDAAEKAAKLVDGRLDPDDARTVLERVMAQMDDWGVAPDAHTLSPITGGKSTKAGKGNVEFLVLTAPAA